MFCREEQLPQRVFCPRTVTFRYDNLCIRLNCSSLGTNSCFACRASQRLIAARHFAGSSTAPFRINSLPDDRAATLADSVDRYSTCQVFPTALSSMVLGNEMSRSMFSSAASFRSIQLSLALSNSGTRAPSNRSGTTTTSPSSGLMWRRTCRARDDRRKVYAGKSGSCINQTRVAISPTRITPGRATRALMPRSFNSLPTSLLTKR